MIRAAIAEEHLAGALAKAESAKATAKGFESKIAEPNARAEEARSTAESEHLARVKIEERLKPRNLEKKQQQRVADRLRRFPRTPYELAVDPVQEALTLLATIEAILRSAGWTNKESAKTELRSVFTLSSGSKVEQEYGSGVVIKLTQALLDKYSRAAHAFSDALKIEGIDSMITLLSESDPSPYNIHIIIGSKE